MDLNIYTGVQTHTERGMTLASPPPQPLFCLAVKGMSTSITISPIPIPIDLACSTTQQ